jgi:hypothetical protein
MLIPVALPVGMDCRCAEAAAGEALDEAEAAGAAAGDRGGEEEEVADAAADGTSTNPPPAPAPESSAAAVADHFRPFASAPLPFTFSISSYAPPSPKISIYDTDGMKLFAIST